MPITAEYDTARLALVILTPLRPTCLILRCVADARFAGRLGQRSQSVRLADGDLALLYSDGRIKQPGRAVTNSTAKVSDVVTAVLRGRAFRSTNTRASSGDCAPRQWRCSCASPGTAATSASSPRSGGRMGRQRGRTCLPRLHTRPGLPARSVRDGGDTAEFLHTGASQRSVSDKDRNAAAASSANFSSAPGAKTVCQA